MHIRVPGCYSLQHCWVREELTCKGICYLNIVFSKSKLDLCRLNINFFDGYAPIVSFAMQYLLVEPTLYLHVHLRPFDNVLLSIPQYCSIIEELTVSQFADLNFWDFICLHSRQIKVTWSQLSRLDLNIKLVLWNFATHLSCVLLSSYCMIMQNQPPTCFLQKWKFYLSRKWEAMWQKLRNRSMYEYIFISLK